jgi:hypothetical protein
VRFRPPPACRGDRRNQNAGSPGEARLRRTGEIFRRLVPRNPAGEASRGRDQSAGYARRSYLSRDRGPGFDSRRLHWFLAAGAQRLSGKAERTEVDELRAPGEPARAGVGAQDNGGRDRAGNYCGAGSECARRPVPRTRRPWPPRRGRRPRRGHQSPRALPAPEPVAARATPSAGRFLNHDVPVEPIQPNLDRPSTRATIEAIRHHYDVQLGLLQPARCTVNFPADNSYCDIVLPSRHPRGLDLWNKTTETRSIRNCRC